MAPHPQRRPAPVAQRRRGAGPGRRLRGGHLHGQRPVPKPPRRLPGHDGGRGGGGPVTAEPTPAFNPRRRRPPAERPPVGPPPDPDLLSTPVPARTALAVVAPPAAPDPATADDPATLAAGGEDEPAGERAALA